MMHLVLLLLLVVLSISIVLLVEAEANIEFKKYTVINSPKVCGDKLCSEVDVSRSQKGLSTRDIPVCGDRLCSDIMQASKSPQNLSSPMGQFKFGIALDSIQCKEESHVLVIKLTNHTPACVMPSTTEKLISKGWAESNEKTQEIMEEISEHRQKGLLLYEKSQQDYSFGLSITHNVINDQEFLRFDGFGWHRLHNVEITITSQNGFETLIRSKTDDRGNLFMPWPIPENAQSGQYHVFATDGIRQFEIDIPIILGEDTTAPIMNDMPKCFSQKIPIDWPGCDLYGRVMTNIDLRGANIQGANLFGANLSNKDLTGADFSFASLKKANLDGSKLTGADFSFSNLIDAEIRNADASFAKFIQAKLYRTDFTNSNLTNANFQDATMSYSILSFTDLKNANFDGAGTWNANLNHCHNHPICE